MIREDIECKVCGESLSFNGPTNSRNWNTIKTLFRVMHSYDHKPEFSQTEIETAPAAVLPDTSYSRIDPRSGFACCPTCGVIEKHPSGNYCNDIYHA